ncbi:hypothetical protein TWF281_011864 [Arthrobotrys megalospora]
MDHQAVFALLEQVSKTAASYKVNGHFLFLLFITVGYFAMVFPAMASAIITQALSMALALLPFFPPLVLVHMFFKHPETYADLESVTLLFVGKLVSILGNHFHGLSIEWMEGHPGLQNFLHQVSTKGLSQLIQDLAVRVADPPHTPLSQLLAPQSPATTAGNEDTTKEPGTAQLDGEYENSDSDSGSDSGSYSLGDDEEDDDSSGVSRMPTTTTDEILRGLDIGVRGTDSTASDEAGSGSRLDVEDPLAVGTESSPGEATGPVTVPRYRLRTPTRLDLLWYSRGGWWQAPETPCPKRRVVNCSSYTPTTPPIRSPTPLSLPQIPRNPLLGSPEECETLAGLVASSIPEPRSSPVVQRYASDNMGYLQPPPGFEGGVPGSVPFWASGSAIKGETRGIHRRVSRFAHIW